MTSVRDVMTEKPVAATVPSSRRDLMPLFLKHGHAGFPVVRAGSQKLLGLVTRHDILSQPDEDQVALLMNPNPLTTYPTAHVREAARMLRHGQARTLPVVTNENDLVGILTPADLLEVLRGQAGPVSPHLGRRHVPVHRGTPAPVAFEILRSTRVGALPVLGDDGALCGILTDGDLLERAEVTDTIVHTVAGIAAEGDEWTWEGLRDVRRLQHATTRIDLPPRPVGDFMVADVVTVMPQTSVGQAAARMLEGNFSQLPVVDGEGRVVDLLTDVDLLGVLLT